MALRFCKMHGAGNHFVVIDLRGGLPAPSPELARALGDRHTGVGFDQLLSIEDSARGDCLARYRIWNSDGSAAQQCGNGARCVAAWLVRDGAATPPRFRLDSPAGPIDVDCLPDGRYALQMGVPDFRPDRIPMHAASEAPEYAVTLGGKALHFGAASMGNPHALLVVEDIARAAVDDIGPALQQSGLFPEGVNVGFAQIESRARIRLRVYERGAGETLACGSGACAAVAILVRQGRVDRQVEVQLPGGMLEIHWPADERPIRMAGPAAFVFEGEWSA
jgi:diaminopimelate epimerase